VTQAAKAPRNEKCKRGKITRTKGGGGKEVAIKRKAGGERPIATLKVKLNSGEKKRTKLYPSS